MKLSKIDLDEKNRLTQENIDKIRNSIDRAIEEEKSENFSLQYPICIPSCRNRKPTVLDNLGQFGNTPIFVFNYENEVDLYSWLDLPNVTKVSVPIEYLSIQKMRQFIQNYMGERTYWVSDDDTKGFLLSNKTIKTSVAIGCRALEIFFEDIPFSGCGFIYTDIAAKFWKPGPSLYNDSQVLAGIGLFNGKALKEAGVFYPGDKDINEDREFSMLAAIKKVPFKIVSWGIPTYLVPPAGKNSIASSINTNETFNMYYYTKYGNNSKMFVKKKKNGSVTLHCQINWHNLSEEITYDETILNYCKNKDSEGLKQYLLSLRG